MKVAVRFGLFISITLLSLGCHHGKGKISGSLDGYYDGKEVSASMQRYIEQWKQTETRNNEFYTSFHYAPAPGLGYEEGVNRRDPSTIIKVGETFYVYYTKTPKNVNVVGYDKADMSHAATTWDMASIYYATSKDGHQWQEQSLAVPPGPRGEFDDRSVFTPDILVYQGKYYLYYQAVQWPFKRRTKNVIGMSWSEHPEGPWHRHPEPILRPGEAGEWDGDVDNRSLIKKYGAFDSHKVHDPMLIVREGKLWLYYKSHPMGVGSKMRKPYPDFAMGLATAEQPEGPFEKHPLNPVSASGHEVVVWPYKKGVATLTILNGVEKNTIQFAPDGVNFEVMSVVVAPPDAAGPYRPDAFANTTDGQGIEWGLCHVPPTPEKPFTFFVRFECGLSQRRAGDRRFKQENIRFSDEALYNLHRRKRNR